MNTKYYTSVEQSKKLLKLGLNSDTADMVHVVKRNDCRESWESAAEDLGNVYTGLKNSVTMCLSDYAIPCWSLEALLNILPSVALDGSYDHHYRLQCKGKFTEWYDSAVDACVNMIEKLHKQNLLQFN